VTNQSSERYIAATSPQHTCYTKQQEYVGFADTLTIPYEPVPSATGFKVCLSPQMHLFLPFFVAEKDVQQRRTYDATFS